MNTKGIYHINIQLTVLVITFQDKKLNNARIPRVGCYPPNPHFTL